MINTLQPQYSILGHIDLGRKTLVGIWAETGQVSAVTVYPR